MTLSRMFDAAFPPVKPFPGCHAAAGYIGYRGNDVDTPHLWTLAEWNRATDDGRLRSLPVWMPSLAGDPTTQAAEAARRAIGLGWQPNHKIRRVIALDMETHVETGFVAAFAAELHRQGFGCWVYGSWSTVFGNPREEGYWVAAYPGPGPVLDFPEGHVVAHQYAADVAWLGGAVDLSVVSAVAIEHLGKGPRRAV